jgi:hypothetical protein
MNSSMSSSLFTELSVSEQAVISGGDAQSINGSLYFRDFIALGGRSSSGPHGSYSENNAIRDRIFTAGIGAVTFGPTETIASIIAAL